MLIPRVRDLNTYTLIYPQGMQRFSYQDINLSYRDIHYIAILESFVLDIYRVGLLKKNDIVLDIGAGIGDFSILASKRIGINGKVIAIEPNIEDYKLLQQNISNNNCPNIIPINIGVGREPGERTITFMDRTFKFSVDSLGSILNRIGINNQKINFVKMDIEGSETEVLSHSFDIIKCVPIISIELHNTKEAVDKILTPHGFTFMPVTKTYIYKQILKKLVFHTLFLYRCYISMKKKKPDIINKVAIGLDITKNDNLLVGSYINKKSFDI
jgi:FkbM family methyltransferase